MEIIGNRAVENAAVAWVIDLERAAGRLPRDTRFQGAAADVESPPRLIEVKSYGRYCRGEEIWLEVRQVEEARRNGNFHLYIVENVRQGDPALFELKVLHGDRLQRLLARAKEQRFYTLPLPVAEYDACPRGLG